MKDTCDCCAGVKGETEDASQTLRRLEAELAEAGRRVRELEAELEREARWARLYYERWAALRGGFEDDDGGGLGGDSRDVPGDGVG